MNKCLPAYLLVVAIFILPLRALSQGPADTKMQSVPTAEIRQDDLQDLQQYDKEVAKWLVDAPNDPSGKQSPLYPEFRAWSAGLHRLVSSRRQVDAFKLIPLMVHVFAAGKTEGAADELKMVKDRMNDCGVALIMAAGAYVKQHHGKVNVSTLSRFVRLFSVGGFFMEPAWEDLMVPIAPAGLLIINPTAVVRQLESGPWEQAQRFIGGNTSAADFFEAYTSKGDGLAVLKTKYAAQQALIDGKFGELVIWEAQQESANPH